MKKIYFCVFVTLIGITQVPAQDVNLKTLYRDVYYLADDHLEGRGTGEKGCESAANYLVKRFAQIGLEAKGDSGTYLQKFKAKLPANPHSTTDTSARLIKSSNVVGFLNNQAKNTIIIGAHYDHLGLGNDGNSLEANSKGKIHNGADDNASGVAGVLSLAEILKSNSIRENYNFLFVCFSGEELGLIGSKKFCEKSPIPLNSINLMINMDMIGRLDSMNRLIVYGVGTAAPLVDILNKTNQIFKLKLDSSGIGPSDHTSFYLQNVPVLHFFTGQHADYHKPGDDVGKINFKGERSVLQYINRILLAVNDLPKLEFLKTRNADTENTPKFKVTLGIMPDYIFEGSGVRADGVSEGKAAAKAGLQKGDIIVKLGDYPVKDMHSYMEALSKFKKGDSTKVEVQRGKENKVFDLTFQ